MERIELLLYALQALIFSGWKATERTINGYGHETRGNPEKDIVDAFTRGPQSARESTL